MVNNNDGNNKVSNTTLKLLLTGGTFGGVWASLGHGGLGGVVAAGVAYVVLEHSDSIIGKVAGKFSPRHGYVDAPITPEELAEYRRTHGTSANQHVQYEETGEVNSYDDQEFDTAENEIKTFRQLLEDGSIQAALKEGKIVLGYIDSVLYNITIKGLYSCGIGGVSGTGKSTTVRFLLFQFALLGARLIMIDPHLDEPEESLAAQFRGFTNIHAMSPCSDNVKDVEKRVRKLTNEFNRRKEKGIKGPYLIFVIDELNGLMRRLSPEQRGALAQVLLNIEQEGRKYGMFCMLIGQRWSDQDLGGSGVGAAIRSSLASTIAHRFQDEAQAAKLVGSQNKNRCLSLPNGNYLFRDTGGNLSQVYTPNTLAEDATLVQQLLDEWKQQRETRSEPRPNTDFQDTKPTETHTENLTDETREIRPNADFQRVSDENETRENPEMHALGRTIMKLQAEGKNKQEIIKQIWNANPGANEAYEQAKQEYQKALQYMAERLG